MRLGRPWQPPELPLTLHVHPLENYRLRLATAADLALIAAIEREAAAQFPASVFAGGPPGLQAHTLPAHTLSAGIAASLLWVAASPHNDAPVGFLLAQVEDNALHIAEMDVHPAHGRRGVGAALVRVACAAASQRGLRHVTLTTFADVPWNGPFYERQGFTRVADTTLAAAFAHLATTLRQEAELGLAGRIGMVKTLHPSSTAAPPAAHL